MFQQILNWRTGLAAIAIAIVIGTIFYSQYLAHKIAREERQKVEHWVEATKALINPNTTDVRLPFRIISDNHDIPIIETNENDSITNYVNVDSAKAINDKNYLPRRLESLKSINQPIVYTDPYDSTKVNRYYFGHTTLLNEVRYYPLVQLFIVGLFIIVTILALRSSYRSVQNQVWAGMAKETAHQLGTPVSSLEGWVEMLKEKNGDEKIVQELSKDVDRLRLVSDRFGKIGSTPQLEETDLVNQIARMVEYIKKRAPGKIGFSIDTHGQEKVTGLISPPLFDWVIENLLKNALDAMEGKGAIAIDIREEKDNVIIDVTDTGKGISTPNISKVFKPGFTTKKRGWGLGLSLSRRIINQYHKGDIFVKSSELGKGTTFRIILKRPVNPA
jgi:signal transduction histidine kinase